MALIKQILKSRPVVKVTFSIAAEAAGAAKNIVLVGDFNSWNPDDATALKKQKDGSFKAIVELAPGRDYQFRYLIDGNRWSNDWEADKYVPSGVTNEENSVVIL